MSFAIKTTGFEGPLDLLLDLIEKKKLFISDISLAQVADDFISHIRQFETMPMDESAHFILVASTLLLIKSKSLLPQLSLTTDEQGDIRDLETRLKIYKRIKDASIHVNELFGAHVIYPQSHARAMEPIFAPDPSFSLEKAALALRDLVARLPKKERIPQVTVQKVISLEDMIGTLTKRINGALRMSFKEFSREHAAERVNVIVSFLSMLELVKQGIINVSQENTFDDIQMETKEIGVPRY